MNELEWTQQMKKIAALEKAGVVDPASEITGGELKGWEIPLKLVTNGCGEMALVFPTDVVAVGPTKNPGEIVSWFRDYMLEA